MLKKFIFPFFFIFFIYSCGYSPIYLNTSEVNFEISNFEISGNYEINSIVENRLKKYFNNNSTKKYNVEIYTNYQKVSVAKDTTGNTTNFKIIVDLDLNYTQIETVKESEKRNIFFSEELIIKRNQNNYEQGNYEQIIIKDMTQMLTERLILHLTRS